MKKKLLFIAPNYYGFNEVVYSGLKSFSGYEVIEINSTRPYQYKNIGEKIYNFFLKTFKKDNLKKIKTEQYIQQTIEDFGQYDLLIVNRPDLLTEEALKKAITKSKKSKVILWDSLKKIPQPNEYLAKFDNILSFDPDDCIHYGFTPITNFYFKEAQNWEIKFDVALLMTYDNRINDAIKLFRYFDSQGINAKARIFVYKKDQIKEKLPENMEVIEQIIPFKKSCEYYFDSKAILDLSHSNQKGLSFRPFEALGLEKKLITTAENVKSLEFYNATNILYIKDIDNIDFPKKFLDEKYLKPSLQVAKRYSLKNWVESIIS
ncbi:lipopolysaccharide core biosynthesis protein rfaS [Sphingobacterium sp. HMA12]|uniref:lipopolysaccharide core biosynthesis protein rfaS n=1 Tax=Sphingobacterium sp. HMA12 TaxID=2050894 RepID=UPI000CE9E5FA|nr:lipopolysaccharide core biosynthesis protein rfaS [Sphingobacterium sp. HMA12]